jgi:hypothetical protein
MASLPHAPGAKGHCEDTIRLEAGWARDIASAFSLPSFLGKRHGSDAMETNWQQLDGVRRSRRCASYQFQVSQQYRGKGYNLGNSNPLMTGMPMPDSRTSPTG